MDQHRDQPVPKAIPMDNLFPISVYSLFTFMNRSSMLYLVRLKSEICLTNFTFEWFFSFMN